MSESVNKKYRWCRGGGKTPTFDFEDSVDAQKENYKRPQAVTESYKVAFSQSVQIPNNSLGGKKRELVQQLLGSFWSISEGALSWWLQQVVLDVGGFELVYTQCQIPG